MDCWWNTNKIVTTVEQLDGSCWGKFKIAKIKSGFGCMCTQTAIQGLRNRISLKKVCWTSCLEIKLLRLINISKSRIWNDKIELDMTLKRFKAFITKIRILNIRHFNSVTFFSNISELNIKNIVFLHQILAQNLCIASKTVLM